MKTFRIVLLAAAALPVLMQAQVFRLSKDQMVALTVSSPATFERFPDGRPKVPDSFIERAKAMSAEESWAILSGGQSQYKNQWADGFQVLHPGVTMAGRAFTVQFMPARADLNKFATDNARAAGITTQFNNQAAIDMLQPGDVLVVDLGGKIDGATIVGDNLFYYVMKTTKGAGMVVDGAIRDLQGIAEMSMPAYFRGSHPSALVEMTITGINIPIRIGNTTVMPGDLVVGDREGVYFIPPALATQILDNADTLHIHDEWSRMKFDEGKYKSSEIYSSPRDPALRAEYQAYLTKKLEELKKQRAEHENK